MHDVAQLPNSGPLEAPPCFSMGPRNSPHCYQLLVEAKVTRAKKELRGLFSSVRVRWERPPLESPAPAMTSNASFPPSVSQFGSSWQTQSTELSVDCFYKILQDIFDVKGNDRFLMRSRQGEFSFLWPRKLDADWIGNSTQRKRRDCGHIISAENPSYSSGRKPEGISLWKTIRITFAGDGGRGCLLLWPCEWVSPSFGDWIRRRCGQSAGRRSSRSLFSLPSISFHFLMMKPLPLSMCLRQQVLHGPERELVVIDMGEVRTWVNRRGTDPPPRSFCLQPRRSWCRRCAWPLKGLSHGRCFWHRPFCWSNFQLSRREAIENWATEDANYEPKSEKHQGLVIVEESPNFHFPIFL